MTETFDSIAETGGESGAETGAEAAPAAGAETDLDALLQKAVDEARRLLETDTTVIYLVNRDECSYWAYDSGLNDEARAEARSETVQVGIGRGVSGTAIATREMVITEDYVNDERFWDAEARRLNAEHLGTTSVVAVPMAGRHGPLGAFCVFDRRHRRFSEFELALLNALAGHAAFAIENARLNRRLLATREQAAELAASRERARLAQELHDSVTQALFSMTLTARSAEILLDRDFGAVREKLGELRELAQDALTEMRSLIFELRPGNVEEEGLDSALRKHVAAVQSRTGLPVTLEVDLPDEGQRLPLDVEETLYRIAQEALHNVVKHAAARSARIEVDWKRDVARLAVIDDGVGFDPAVAIRSGRIGLPGMSTRLGRVGGRLDIDSRRGFGTRLVASVPVPADALRTSSVGVSSAD